MNWRLCTSSYSAGSTRPDAGLRPPYRGLWPIAAFGRRRPRIAAFGRRRRSRDRDRCCNCRSMKFVAKICDGTRQILALCDHKFVIVKKRFETGIVLQPILSPLMTHARFLDNRPPVPLRSLRFARFLSTGGDNSRKRSLQHSCDDY